MEKAAYFFLCLAVLGSGVSASRGASTVFVEHKTEAQFKKGTGENTLIRSDGQLTLAYQTQKLLDSNPKILAINAVEVDSQGTVFLAGSGLGYIYRILPGASQAELIYGDDPGHFKHIFSLAFDNEGRLLAGTGGENAALLRRGKDNHFEILFQDETVKYIWAIATGPAGRIYLATGPEGKIFTLDPDGTNPQLLYRAKDTNILSLALDANGILYAGGDKYGLVYRVDPATGQTTVAYDTGHKEISGLVFDREQNLYVSTSDTGIPRRGASLLLSDEEEGASRSAGTPEAEEPPSEEGPPEGSEEFNAGSNAEGDIESPDGETETSAEPMEKLSPPEAPLPESLKAKSPGIPEDAGRMMKPSRANEIFKITPEGFVRSIFQKPIIIFDLAYNASDNSLLLATADQGRILKFDLDTLKVVVLHSAMPSSQVTSLKLLPDGSAIAGLANPSGGIKILPMYVSSGFYQSEAIDGQNVTRWGSVHIEAELPDQTALKLSFRTGNTSKPEEGPWSDWSDSISAKESLSISSPPGRFFQYRVDFSTELSSITAKLHSLKFSQRQPNYPPRITSMDTRWIKEQKPKNISPFPDELSILQIAWKAEDDNHDSLLYNLYLRPYETDRWVQIAKELKTVPYKWDSRFVEDGKYEIKVEVTDKLSNTASDTLSDFRLGDPFIVDNTPPQITDFTWSSLPDGVKCSALLNDSFSTILSIQYSLDSSEQWQSVLPTDGILDNNTEQFVLTAKTDTPGNHWLSIRICDSRGNAIYKNINFSTTDN